MTTHPRELSNFGRHLRHWRSARKLSQLDLASLADTTPRHVSFVETGRSRPGHALILRLANALTLSMRDTNRLLTAAGLPPEYPELPFGGTDFAPFRDVIAAMLTKHNPYPACAMNSIGDILMTNKAFTAFSPGIAETTPEAGADLFFDPDGPFRDQIENWEEVAFNILDRQRIELSKTHDPRLEALVQRCEGWLHDVPRSTGPSSDVILTPRFRIGESTIATYGSILRFESAAEVTLSEVRVELVFPADPATAQFFEDLTKNSDALPFAGIG